MEKNVINITIIPRRFFTFTKQHHPNNDVTNYPWDQTKKQMNATPNRNTCKKFYKHVASIL